MKGTKEQIKVQVLGDAKMSKSEKMRQLYKAGYEIKEIKVLMGTSYNYVYNVISNMAKTDGIELRTKKRGSGDTVKAKVVRMYEAGMKKSDIAKELNELYNYVWKICHEVDEAKAKAE